MENQKPVTPSEEIDLSELFSKIGVFFKNTAYQFIRFLALLRRIPLENKAFFGIVVISCIVIGLSYSSFLSKNYYESTMIISSDYFNKRLVENTMEKLNLLAEEKDKTGLTKVLHIDLPLAKNILEFKARPFVDENELIELEILKEQLKNAQLTNKNDKTIEEIIKRIEIENRHAFEITVRMFNPTVISDLQTALIDYLRNGDYFKRRIEISRINQTAKLNKISRDLQKLDSLKFILFENYRSMATQRQGSNNVILSDKSVTDPVALYNEDLLLYDKQQEISEKIYLQSDFEIVDGFTEFSEPASASRLKIVFMSVLIGIVIAYLLVGFSKFNTYLSRVA